MVAKPRKPSTTPEAILNPETVTAASGWVVVDEVDKDGQVLRSHLDEETIKELKFDKPGKSLSGKRCRVIKAIMPSGVLVQLPWEDQINNSVAGDLSDHIGLRVYERKGATLLFDEDDGAIYCKGYGCWAQGNKAHQFYCCEGHRKITEPNPPPGIMGLGFGVDATTSRSFYG